MATAWMSRRGVDEMVIHRSPGYGSIGLAAPLDPAGSLASRRAYSLFLQHRKILYHHRAHPRRGRGGSTRGPGPEALSRWNTSHRSATSCPSPRHSGVALRNAPLPGPQPPRASVVLSLWRTGLPLRSCSSSPLRRLDENPAARQRATVIFRSSAFRPAMRRARRSPRALLRATPSLRPAPRP